MPRREVQVESSPGGRDGEGPGPEGEVRGDPDERPDGGLGPRPKAFDANYDRGKRSTREERKVAKRLGGRTHKRSGGLPWSRHDDTTACGDITTPDLHIEHKRIEPDTKSIGVKREWLKKVTEGASRRMKTPAMAFHFERAQGFSEDWLMLPMDLAERLLAMLREE